MKLLLINILTLCTISSFSQTSQSGDIETLIGDIITNMPSNSGNDFAEPTASELVIWEDIIDDILLDDATAAHNHANSIGYEIILFTDNTVSPSKLYYILQKTVSSLNYWGTYVFNPTACRSTLIIQSPHPKYDTNTGHQGIYCFKNVDARAYFLSGTHRCNHSSFTVCSGSSSVCTGSSNSFQISDLPHNTNNVFQTTTEILYHTIPNSVFIQLHGFGKQTTDPYVIMSNGTRNTPSGTDYTVALQNALLTEDNVLTFKTAHVDLTWSRLVGFTNTQGRLVNGESNPCSSSANATTGRFIHVEQEKVRLRNDASVWVKMANALSNTFSCVALPVQISSFEVLLSGNHISLKWITESEQNNDFFTIERAIDGANWQVIGRVDGSGNSTTTINYQFIDKTPLNGTIYYRIKQTDFDGNFEYSSVQSIAYHGKSNILIFPNPSTGEVFIHATAELYAILVFNSIGQVVKQLQHPVNLQSIRLPKGNYYIQLISKDDVQMFQQVIF